MFEIKEVSVEKLSDYEKIPMLIEGHSILTLKKVDQGLGGILLEEVEVSPFIKDLGKEEDVSSWPKEFDVSNWAFFIVYDKKQPIGGATLVYQTKGIRMLSGREDLGVLWDIRVDPRYKNQGIGKALFHKCETWAKNKNCTQLKIETQNNNVPANRFYAKNGCLLGEINEYAYYGEYDDEVMLIWYKNL